MVKFDFKKIINPFIAFPLVLILIYIIGLRGINLIFYSFISFFFLSLINNIILILGKKVRKRFYLYVYMELFFSLIFMIPLFYLINLKNPILISLFIIGLIEFIIQAYYNIFPREDGKKILKLWQNKLIKSEREYFHPVSLQKHTFKDFTCKILEPGKINPARNHVMNHRLMESKLLKYVIKNQFGNENTLVFSINDMYLKDRAYTYKGTHIDKIILAKLRKIDEEITKNIITCYMFRQSFLRIVFNKDFVLNNSEKTYDFLKKVKQFFQNPNISRNK